VLLLLAVLGAAAFGVCQLFPTPRYRVRLVNFSGSEIVGGSMLVHGPYGGRESIAIPRLPADSLCTLFTKVGDEVQVVVAVRWADGRTLTDSVNDYFDFAPGSNDSVEIGLDRAALSDGSYPVTRPAQP
jgi:hypothetical protein